MRTYGGKLIRSKMRGMIAESRESRDGVLWDVDLPNRRCRVKIQGSNAYITAYFPLNWSNIPEWLKAGNAVRIAHPGGNKGRIEVVGHGLLIPSAIAGVDVTPPDPTPSDAVLSGLGATPTGGMTVSIAPGTYRIDDVIYTLGAVVMDRTDIEMDMSSLYMDGGADVITFAAAHATYFRYDSIVVGIDGDAHAVQGDNFADTITPPGDRPSIPADHIEIGWVLIYPGMTEITVADLNRTFTTPAPALLTATPAASSIAWDETPPIVDSTTILFEMRDQYNRLFSIGTDGYHVTITFQTGNGTLINGAESSTSSLSFYMTTTKTITYERDMDVGDSSPLFTVVEDYSGFETAFFISLLSITGSEMF